MSAKSLPPLSASEQAIMDHLWRSSPTGLNDLLSVINIGRAEPLSRATLQTQLTRLEAKGWVRRDDSERAHSYEPAVPEARGRKSVLHDLKRRFFGGSSLAMVRCLVESGEITDAELTELRRLVRDTAKKSADEGGRP
ncbi:MAG: BlaI/MecI/CopY family transcriptional regulator [Roseimicrobium sp.]